MSDPKLKAGFDDTEPRAGWVLAFSIGTIVTIIATMVFVTAYYDQVHARLVYERQELPINDDLRTLRAKEDSELHSYGYADKQAGLVRVTSSAPWNWCLPKLPRVSRSTRLRRIK